MVVEAKNSSEQIDWAELTPQETTLAKGLK